MKILIACLFGYVLYIPKEKKEQEVPASTKTEDVDLDKEEIVALFYVCR